MLAFDKTYLKKKFLAIYVQLCTVNRRTFNGYAQSLKRFHFICCLQMLQVFFDRIYRVMER